MTSIPPNKLTLLPFPQQWKDGSMIIRAVALPRGNPLLPLMTGIPGVPDGPAFAVGNLQLKAMLIPSLDELPNPVNVAEEVGLDILLPEGKGALFREVAQQFDIDPSLEPTQNPRCISRRFKKLLVPSYCKAFAFSTPRTPFAVLDDSYACALRDPCRLRKPQGPPPSTKTVWGRILAQALRQPLLAKLLGLIYEVNMQLPDPATFENGGWLYLMLDKESDYAEQVAADPKLLSVYAARIPPLNTTARNLFAAVLFPVSSAPPTGNFDELFGEAADYDDGFAKIVHCAQQTTSDPVGIEREDSLPVVTDTGIQLGWDDEQILIWMNRQITNPLEETRESPMGVIGYRVDVREAGTAKWFSLMLAKADLVVGSTEIGSFEGELTVEVEPLQLDNREDGDYWMPTYFTQWQGRSLVSVDTLGLRLSGVSEEKAHGYYQPVGGDDVPLRYGKTYEFRVRLVDISGGGPGHDSEPVNPAPAPIALCKFRRYVRPREVLISGIPEVIDPTDPPIRLEIYRPRLAYPAAVYAGIPNAEQALLNDLQLIVDRNANGEIGREPGLPDPDVETVEICMQVVGLEFDTANSNPGPPPLRTVYTTSRSFPKDDVTKPIALELEYCDASDIEMLNATDHGPIPVPTARDVLITFTPTGKDDANLDYFGSQEARIGRSTNVQLRRAPFNEKDLFVPDTEGNRLRAIMLHPDEVTTQSLFVKLAAMGKGEEAETDMISRLAAELGLNAHGMTLIGRPGHRIVFGCSKAIPHILAPDLSAITFSSKADLAHRWILVVKVSLARDWTWDGVGEPGLQFYRDNGLVGSVRIPRSINPTIIEGLDATGDSPNRSSTDIIFFDAVDPKPPPSQHPQEMQVSYTIIPQFRHKQEHVDQLSLTVDLPVAVQPTQTPKLASAGIALSQYIRSPDYSSTEPRQRMLWFEFSKMPENPDDTYFARVLSYAPDPMLTRNVEVSLPPEPPLPIDPEYIRVIRPGQSDDKAGLSAMQQLIPTESERHFLVPLPPGLNSRSRELFGFFVYELRVGHCKQWSTAKARFGPALRVTGVQHPVPFLSCQVMRTADSIIASTSFAAPVFNGRNLLPRKPATELWILLYAQVTQVDGKDHRNVLLSRKRAWMRKDIARRRGEAKLTGSVTWTQDEVKVALEAYALSPDSPLSVMAVELLPETQAVEDPLGTNLGQERIYRTSPLTKVPSVCTPPPCPPP